MATINGTAGNDVYVGTTGDDVMNGGAGNDRLNGGAGNDLIFGGEGADTLTGDAGNDILYGGAGNDGFFGGGNNDTIYGEAGNDVMFGDAGDDILFGGEGDDTLHGGTGNDTLIGGSGVNILNGGAGVDTIVFEFTAAELTAAKVNDLVTFASWLDLQITNAGSTAALAAQATGASISLAALGATVSTVENYKIRVDGVETSLASLVGSMLNQAPVAAAAVSAATDEDTAFSGVVAATDPNGDALTFSVVQGPAHGALTLNASTGAYTYAPNADFAGTDVVRVLVSDGRGGTTTQDVTITVAEVNDEPTLAATASVGTNEDQAVSGNVAASDVEGQALTWAVATGPANGVLSLNAATGHYTYTPSANAHGADAFRISVTDSAGAVRFQDVAVAIAAINDAPTAAAAQALSVDEDGSVAGSVGATDVDGDILSYAVSAGPAHGAVALNAATGAYTYTPDANFNGADAFTILVSDGNGGTAEQTVSISVNAVNDAPTAPPSSVLNTTEDQSVDGNVVGTDVDGDALTWSMTVAPLNGWLALNSATGAYTYTPAANYRGTDWFQVTVWDVHGQSSAHDVWVNIGDVNDAPTTAPAAMISTSEDAAVSGAVTAFDADGDTLSYAVSQGPAHGAVSLNTATGAYTYTPTANYNGTDTFRITVSDGNGGSAVQTVTIGVNAVNDAPVAAPASISTNEDSAFAGTVGAADADGDTLSYSVAQGPAHGALMLNAATGAYVYTPTANYNGGDSFRITVSDGNGGSVVQDVTVAVNAANDAPTTAAAASKSTNEDTAVTGTVTATDVDGDALSYAVTQAPAHGSVSLNAATGAYVYTPTANYNGADSFRITVSDGNGGSAVQQVNVGVNAVNDAPAAPAASISTNEDGSFAGAVGATDADGDTLSYAVTQGPAHGALSLNAATGAYTYTPTANYNGADTFKITVSDGNGGSVVQDVTVAVNAVNDAPTTAASASKSTNEDTAVTGTVAGADIDGDALTYSVDAAAAHGVVTLNAATGAYTYTPAANYNGADSFAIRVSDGNGGSAVQTVTVAIAAVNDAPITSAVSRTTNEDTVLTGAASAMDVDGDVLSYAVSQGPAHGALSLNAATGAYTYTPAANYNGGDSFKILISDGSGGSVVQDVSVTVAAVNDAPIVTPVVAKSTNEDTAVTGTVGGTDIEGQALTYAVTGAATHGAVSLNPTTGAYTYTPAANYSGADFFDVTVTDAGGASSIQRVNVTIAAVGDTPSLSVVGTQITPTGEDAGLLGLGLFGAGGQGTVTVGLDISSALTDLDGSESLSVRISGMPAGATLNAGVNNGGGVWTLSAADLVGLTITATVSADFTLSVTATSTEATGQTATSAASSILIDVRAADSTQNGSGSANTINGSTGNDRLVGNGGNDTINGNNGADWIDGGADNDTLTGGAGNDVVSGGTGNDTIHAGAGNDVYTGGAGTDTLTYAAATSGVTINLARNVVSGTSTGIDALGDAFELIIGSGHADSYVGSSAADTFNAGGGNDVIRGAAGADILTGGAGADRFVWQTGDTGIDRITDFAGDILDVRGLISYSGGPASDYVDIRDTGADLTVAVKIGGVFVDIAVLEGVQNQTATSLFDSGQLLIA